MSKGNMKKEIELREGITRPCCVINPESLETGKMEIAKDSRLRALLDPAVKIVLFKSCYLKCGFWEALHLGVE